MILVVSCRNDPASSPEELQTTMESQHFKYFLSEFDQIDTTWQETYYTWLIDTLNVSLNQKLVYHKYENRQHLKEITGRNTNGFAEVGTYDFHTIWPVDNHESVHNIVTLIIGHPPALFNEGIAVAHQAIYSAYPDKPFIPGWNGQDFDQLSKEYLADSFPTLDELIESKSFFKFDTNKTYPVAGSFVRYLIDKHGLEKMKAFISKSEFNAKKASTKAHFSDTYDMSINDAWDEWKTHLETNI